MHYFTAAAWRHPVAPPTSPSAQNGATILIAWVPPTRRAINTKGFVIERSANGTSGWTFIGEVGPSATQYTDAAPLAGTNYYRVREFNKNGWGATSNVVSAATAIPFDPGAVSNLAFWNPLATGTYSGASIPNVGGNMSAFTQANGARQGTPGSATLNGKTFGTIDFGAQQYLDASGFTPSTSWTVTFPVRFPAGTGWSLFSGGDPASARLNSFQGANQLFINNVGTGQFTLNTNWHLCTLQWVRGPIALSGGTSKGMMRVFWDGVLDAGGASYIGLDLDADTTWEWNCFRQVAAAAAAASYGPAHITNSVLTAAELANLWGWYNTHCGFNVPLPSTAKRLVANGDSNLNGNQVATTWFNGLSLTGSLANYQRTNLGFAGQYAGEGGNSTYIHFFTTEAAQLHPDSHLVYVLEIGTNDLRIGKDAATVIARIKDCVLERRNLLPGAKIICCTIPPQNGTTDDAGIWTATQAVNADMRTNSGNAYGDYILDLGGRYTFADTGNPAKFQDGLHYSQAEQDSIGAWAQPQIAALAS